MSQTNLLCGYLIKQKPQFTTGHLPTHCPPGNTVGITIHGWKDHVDNHKLRRIAIGGTAAAAAVVLTAGGGIGLAMGGEAMGIGVLEQVIFGGAVGGTTATATNKTRTSGGATRLGNYMFANLRGYVVRRRKRLMNDTYVVLVRWTGLDDKGCTVTFESWHNPCVLYHLHKMEPVVCT